MQTRLGSLVESFTNVGLGYGLAVLTQVLVFPCFGIRLPLHSNLKLAAIFTVISIARSYLVRQWFNRRSKKTNG